MKAKILIVDDDPANLDIMETLLADDYESESASSGQACLAMLQKFRPAVVLLDIMMPGMNGYDACRTIKDLHADRFIQVILVSARASVKERLDGFAAGADDYVVKPFDHGELLARIRIHVRLHDALVEREIANAMIQAQNRRLEETVEKRSREVVATRDIAVFALAKLAESRDPETGEHLERMREYSQILATYLSQHGPYREQIDAAFLRDLYLSSPLHDIGKVGIPDDVLLKPGKLTDEEFEVMKRHTLIGAEALDMAVHHTEFGGFLRMARDIARWHHERFDGGGYPDGRKGSEIPLCARIVAVADVYDAVTSRRVYKPAFDSEFARDVILKESGKHFDPVVVEAFERCYDQFLDAQGSLREKDVVAVG